MVIAAIITIEKVNVKWKTGSKLVRHTRIAYIIIHVLNQKCAHTYGHIYICSCLCAISFRLIYTKCPVPQTGISCTPQSAH